MDRCSKCPVQFHADCVLTFYSVDQARFICPICAASIAPTSSSVEGMQFVMKRAQFGSLLLRKQWKEEEQRAQRREHEFDDLHDECGKLEQAHELLQAQSTQWKRMAEKLHNVCLICHDGAGVSSCCNSLVHPACANRMMFYNLAGPGRPAQPYKCPQCQVIDPNRKYEPVGDTIAELEKQVREAKHSADRFSVQCLSMGKRAVGLQELLTEEQIKSASLRCQLSLAETRIAELEAAKAKGRARPTVAKERPTKRLKAQTH